LARATASGQPFCASFWSQTTSFVAWRDDVLPLAVEAATASMAMSNPTAR
jgi:hypothetical protein